jgi:glycosyltransferase involved in cell wall biosynthesis
MSPKRVLVVAPFAPSFIPFRGALIATLVEQGHMVVAAAPELDAETARGLSELGAKPIDIPLQNASLNPLSFLKSLAAMRALMRAEPPDVVFGYAIKPVIITALAGRAERVGRIVSVITGLGYAFTGGREPKRVISCAVASMLYRLALRRSDVIVFLNPDDQKLFRDLRLVPRGKPTHIIDGEGLDIDYFSPAPLPTGAAFLMIARLLKDKGIREFAEAAKRLKINYPEVPIALVGPLYPSPDSLTQAELDDLIRSGIDYKGVMNDVRPAIAECSVYVLPSYREGTPRSVLEAMAMGRAIITSDAPGCRETVIHGENGLLVQPRNPESLYDAMLRFVREPSLASKMGAASRAMAERKYDVKKVNSNLLRYADYDA